MDSVRFYWRNLVDTLSGRFWIAVGLSLTLAVVGAALQRMTLRNIGLGASGALVLLWLGVGTREHFRHLRHDRRTWRDLRR